MTDDELEYIDALIGEDEPEDWRCECGDLNRAHEAFCYRCGAGPPEDESAGERFGFGVCATGRCDEPCGEHGGCARGSRRRGR